jgi:DNA primase
LYDFELKKGEILNRVDIVDVVSEYVALKQRGRRWVGLCPFHSEKTPSFTVTPDLGLFKCFGCGKGGDVFSFIQYRENVPFIEAMQILADRAGVDLGRKGSGGPSSNSPTRADLARINDWAVGFFRGNLLAGETGRSAREYLRSREVADATAELLKLGLATDSGVSLLEAAGRAGIQRPLLVAADLVREGDRGRAYDTFRHRLMFPISDATGRTVGFGGRTLGDDRAKYVNTRQNGLFDKGRNLYGIDLARKAVNSKRRAVVVEGYTDCLAAHQAGFTETVATLGTALTDSQVDLLRRYCDEIILLFDSDEAGEAAADRAIRVALPRCVKVRLAHIPVGKDPSDYIAQAGPEGFSDVLNSAIDALEFKWSQTRARFDADGSDAARREAVMDFLGIIGDAYGTRAVDAIQRGLLLNQVAHLLRLERRELDQLMVRIQKRSTPRGLQASGSGEGARRSAPADEEQAAWTRVLEVLLNEPGVLDSPASLPDLCRIADGRDQRIARNVVQLAQQDGEFRFADLLARCSDPEDAPRIEELGRRGAVRGNYQSRFHEAVKLIRRASDNLEIERSRQRFARAESKLKPFEESRDQFKDFVEGVQEHRHFVPRGRRRGVSMTGTTEEHPDDLATMEQP